MMRATKAAMLRRGCIPKASGRSPRLAHHTTATYAAGRRITLITAPLLLCVSGSATRARDENSVSGSIRADYDSYAPAYDQLDGGAAATSLGFDKLRRQLLAKAHGAVLEVGVGTGLNLPLYSWTSITSLTAVDLSDGMLQQAQQRAASQLPGRPIQFTQASADQLPFPSSSFDCVVDTFSLCVFTDPVRALQEMARVVKPGGQVLLLEHARSDVPLLAGYQDVTEPLVTPISKGCVWNQDVLGMLTQAGLQPVNVSRHVAGLIVSAVAAPTR